MIGANCSGLVIARRGGFVEADMDEKKVKKPKKGQKKGRGKGGGKA